VNVSDAVLIGKGVQHSHEGHAIVCDDFLDGSPPAQQFFEYEGCQCSASFDSEHMPFGPCSQRAAGLDYVTETCGMRH